MAKEPRDTRGIIYVATESFITDVDGVPQTIRAGETRVREGHDLVRRHPQWFKPITAHFEVEQATAAPGEMRSAA